MAEFTAAVYQNEFLADGGTDVNAIVTVTCSGAGAAGQSGSGSAGEIIIVDTSGSMGSRPWRPPRSAAKAAIGEILDGTWFAVIAGSDRAALAYPRVTSGPGLVKMTSETRAEATRAIDQFVASGGTAMAPGSTWPSPSSSRSRGQPAARDPAHRRREPRGRQQARQRHPTRDALARRAAERGDGATARELAAAADRRMEAASHFITELDRTDRPAGATRRRPAVR